MLGTTKNNYLSCLSQAITSKNTVIAFDLHNVVFKKQTRKIVMQSLKLLPKGTWRYTFNPHVWYRFYRIHSQSYVAEDIFQKLSVQYPDLAQFRGDFIRISNAQRPIRTTMKLIKDLKDRGFVLYILSNIGQETFNDLCQIYPELLDYFDGAFIATAENNYMHKPHLSFYEDFKTFIKHEGHADKQILFIDDLKKNIIAAARCDIAGIHFRSPRKLLSIFKKLDIL